MKRYLIFIISILILQFSNAQSDSVEIIMSPYLSTIDATDTIALGQIKQKLEIFKSNELKEFLEFGGTIDSTDNWQLIGRKVVSSGWESYKQMNMSPIIFYASADEEKVFDSGFIFSTFNIREIIDRYFYRRGDESYSWTPRIYKDYLIIEKRDVYIGGMADKVHTDVYYFKKVN